jgi:hypothetical protein
MFQVAWVQWIMFTLAGAKSSEMGLTQAFEGF